MRALIQMIRAIRNARAQLRIPSTQLLEALVDANGLKEVVEAESKSICSLARVPNLCEYWITSREQPAGGQAMTLVVDPLVVRLPLAGVVDIFAERERPGKGA